MEGEEAQLNVHFREQLECRVGVLSQHSRITPTHSVKGKLSHMSSFDR